MSDISVGSALGEGFGLIRRRPLSVLAWGGVQLLLTLASWGLYGPVYISFLGRMTATGGQPPAQDPAFMAQMMQMQGLGLLVGIAGLVVSIVIYCAVFRAVLHPEQNRFAYMRIGAAELFLGVLAIAGYIAFIVALMVVMIPTAIVVGVLAGTHNTAAAVIVGIAVAVAAFVAVIYVGLRFSLVGPMMVQDNAFRLMESWTLTRGRVGSLFAIAVCLILLIMAVEIVLVIVLFAVGAATLGGMAGGFTNTAALFAQGPGPVLAKLAPLLMVLAVLWAPVMGAFMAIMGAPWARAYRDLNQSDLKETFA
ncbi:MAG TPA: hypothetical protein VF459_13910 [Caulobacteraceae bacterium]